MKDYSEIEEDKYGTKHYYNENYELHRLNSAAIEYKTGEKEYWINHICYYVF